MKPLHVPDGTVEALKWLALALMTGDHVNKGSSQKTENKAR